MLCGAALVPAAEAPVPLAAAAEPAADPAAEATDDTTPLAA